MEFKIINNDDDRDIVITVAEIKYSGCIVTTSSPRGEAICFIPGVQLIQILDPNT